MIIHSKDYHDYVFKDGKLIGEFEQMYQNSEVVPWRQDKVKEEWFNKVSLAVIKRALDDQSVHSIHEIGCGLGYFISNFIDLGYRLSGSDISPTAVLKSKDKFPKIDFMVDDIRILKKRPQYDLVMIHALFWYVFPQLTTVLENVYSMVRQGGYLFVAESFPKLDSDFVGKEVIPHPERLTAILSDFFQPLADVRMIKKEYPKDGPNLNWLGCKR